MPHPRFDAFRKRVLKAFPKLFWSHIGRTDPNDCWPWLLRPDNKGYGRVSRLGKMILCHRIAWELTNGKIPEGLKVLHRCDNPICCNPNHLFLGTQRDNTLDCIRKGRFVLMNGGTNGNSKLKEPQVKQIRHLSDKISNRELAEKFNVSRSTIELILKRKVWKHI